MDRVGRLRRAIKGLPHVEPDPAVWARIQSRTSPSAASAGPGVAVGSGSGGGIEQGGFRFATLRRPMALAAGLLLVSAVGLLIVNLSPEVEPRGDTAGLPVNSDLADLNALYRRSQQLEPLARSAGFASGDSTEQALLYRIADLDGQLAGDPIGGRGRQEQVRRLWSKRVATLESLAAVRRGRAVLQPAVY